MDEFTITDDKKKRALSAGSDLPDSDDQLFEISQFPLLDVNEGIANLGSLPVLKELLTMLLEDELPADEANLKQFFEASNWEGVERLAHKMKSGTLYCGIVRMQMACQYLERYRKASQSLLLEKLYHQLMSVIDDTKKAIKNWMA